MDDIFFFKLDEEVEVEVEEEEEEEEEEEDEVLEEEEEIQCDNCNETIVFAKNGVFILSRIRQLLERAEAEGAGERGNSVGGSRRSLPSATTRSKVSSSFIVLGLLISSSKSNCVS